MTVYQQVENIMRVLPKTRDNDKELWLIYAQKFGMALTNIQQETFRRMPSFETIRRSRQRIQELGNYTASKEVDKKRFEKYKNVRQNIKSENPDKLIEGQGYTVLPWGE